MKLTNNWIHGDCLKELKKLPNESVDLIITSPPYHNLRVYSNDPSDLSNCETYEEYYYEYLRNYLVEYDDPRKDDDEFILTITGYSNGQPVRWGSENQVGQGK